jgi:hypothetical protein
MFVLLTVYEIRSESIFRDTPVRYCQFRPPKLSVFVSCSYHYTVKYCSKVTHSARRPITTYQGQATTKLGVNPEHHAIIFTGVVPPREINKEEKLRCNPIQVIPRTPQRELRKESRINYAKVYNVELNVKVQFIGRVARSSWCNLYTDLDATWTSILNKK